MDSLDGSRRVVGASKEGGNCIAVTKTSQNSWKSQSKNYRGLIPFTDSPIVMRHHYAICDHIDRIALRRGGVVILQIECARL